MTITKEQLTKGISVTINPQTDRSRKVMVTGVVDEILTNANSHPHGLLVKLESGEIGRVKALVGSTSSSSEKTVAASNEYEQSIEEIIKKGENHFVEFKTSCLWSQSLSKEEINLKKIGEYGNQTSKVIIAKSISGFLNADGGHLFIGIKETTGQDEVEIIGIDSEIHKLKDKTLDGYRRMLLDTVIKKYFPSYVFNRINDYLQIHFHKINDLTICKLQVFKSSKRVFLKINNQDIFMVRIDASTRQITGEDIVEYCLNRF